MTEGGTMKYRSSSDEQPQEGRSSHGTATPMPDSTKSDMGRKRTLPTVTVRRMMSSPRYVGSPNDPVIDEIVVKDEVPDLPDGTYALVPLPPEGERQIILTTKNGEWPSLIGEGKRLRVDGALVSDVLDTVATLLDAPLVLDALAEGEDSP